MLYSTGTYIVLVDGKLWWRRRVEGEAIVGGGGMGGVIGGGGCAGADGRSGRMRGHWDH